MSEVNKPVGKKDSAPAETLSFAPESEWKAVRNPRPGHKEFRGKMLLRPPTPPPAHHPPAKPASASPSSLSATMRRAAKIAAAARRTRQPVLLD